MDQSSRPETHCAECGAALPADPAEDLCPVCLLTQAISGHSTAATEGDESGTPDAAPRIRYLGDYELLDEIGRGASGVVYRARQTSLDRTVAVKILASGVWSSAQAIERFRSEARSAAILKHPRIVAIYEVGEHEGLPYFSMEHIDGRSLEACLHDGPLPIERAAQITQSLAEAVHFAHRQGIVHRDLKPSNVVADADFEPHITDFGLAKNLAVEQGLTQTGSVLGTPGYMPPEQAGGDAVSPADPRGDVYSLGAILYALLVGSPPFQKETPLETVLEAVRSRPRPPRKLRAAVPRDLETICLRCLEKDPADRYPSAETLADDLGRFSGGRPITGRHGGALGVVARWVRRHRAATAALAALSLAALVVTARLPHLRHERFLAELGREQVQTFEDRRLRLADLLARGRESRRLGDRQAALERFAEAARIEASEARREAIEMVFSPGRRRALSLPAPPLTQISWSDDGLKLATMGKDPLTNRWRLDVRDAGSGELLERGESAPDDRRPMVLKSPRFAVADAGAGGVDRLKVWDPRGGRLLTTDPPAGDPPSGQPAAERFWSLSPNGRLLAYGPTLEQRRFRRGSVGVKDLRRGTDERLRLPGTFSGFLDDEHLLYLDRGVLLAWHLGRRTSTSPAPTDPVLAISSDRSAAALRGSSRSIEVWDLRRRRRKARVAADATGDAEVRLSRDGRMLAVGNGRGPIWVWDLANPAPGARGLRPSHGVEMSARGASFSHDARLIAVPGRGRDQDKIWIWNLETGEEIAFLEGHGAPAWSPTAPVLATRTFDQVQAPGLSTTRPAVALWQIAAPVPSARLDAGVGSLAFTGGGERLMVHGELWGGTSSSYSGVVSFRQALAGQLPPVDVEGQVLTLQLGEAGGQGIDFRALRRHPSASRLPDFPLARRLPDGTEVQVHPYLWVFEPGGEALLLATTRVELKTGSTRGDPSSYTLERRELRSGKIDAWKHNALVAAMAISPDGETVALGDQETAGVSLWRTDTGERTGRLDHRASATVIAFSADGGMIASAGLSDWLEVSTRNGESVASWKLESPPRALAFDPAGELLAIGGEGPEVSLWRLESGHEVARWTAHGGGVAALAFHPDGTLVSASAEGELKAWDLAAARAELASYGLGW